jgi:hypothetical protein
MLKKKKKKEDNLFRITMCSSEHFILFFPLLLGCATIILDNWNSMTIPKIPAQISPVRACVPRVLFQYEFHKIRTENSKVPRKVPNLVEVDRKPHFTTQSHNLLVQIYL